MAKKPKQLASLPAEIDPGLQFDSEGIPEGLSYPVDQFHEDQVTARAYLAKQGLVDPVRTLGEKVRRGATAVSTTLTAGSFVAVFVFAFTSLEEAFIPTLGICVTSAIVTSATLGETTPRIVRKLGAQITRARKERLRSWASAHYGQEFDEHLLNDLQIELAGRQRGVVAQLQSKRALTQPEAPKLKVLQP